jgi:hypothetical protein
MKIPPIPPNCKYFVDDDPFGFSFVYETKGDNRFWTKHIWPLEALEDDMRQIAAYVAERYWDKAYNEKQCDCVVSIPAIREWRAWASGGDARLVLEPLS